MKFITFVLGFVLSVAASADAIVSGHTTMGCDTDQASMGQPTASGDLAPLSEVPATCESFAGKWVGGCFGGGYTYPTNWPEKNGYVVIGPVGVDSLVTAAPVKGVDIYKDEPSTKLSLTLTQNGCHGVTLKVGTTTKEFAFDKRLRSTQTETFRRSCQSGSYSWRRTYDFLHTSVTTSIWKDSGKWFRENQSWDGRDANYGALFLQTVNRDWSLENGSLHVRSTSYVKASHFDPPGFDWNPGNVGSDLCVFRREP